MILTPDDWTRIYQVYELIRHEGDAEAELAFEALLGEVIVLTAHQRVWQRFDSARMVRDARADRDQLRTDRDSWLRDSQRWFQEAKRLAARNVTLDTALAHHKNALRRLRQSTPQLPSGACWYCGGDFDLTAKRFVHEGNCAIERADALLDV